MATSPSATEAAETAKAVAAEARDRIRSEGERAVHAARQNAEALVSERRDFAADYLGDVSDALGSAEATLNERGRKGAAQLVNKAANEVQHLAGRVHGQDVGRVITEVETFARTRPALFFGGAFLVGYAAMRMLAPADDQHQSEDHAYEVNDRELADAYGRGSV